MHSEGCIAFELFSLYIYVYIYTQLLQSLIFENQESLTDKCGSNVYAVQTFYSQVWHSFMQLLNPFFILPGGSEENSDR